MSSAPEVLSKKLASFTPSRNCTSPPSASVRTFTPSTKIAAMSLTSWSGNSSEPNMNWKTMALFPAGRVKSKVRVVASNVVAPDSVSRSESPAPPKSTLRKSSDSTPSPLVNKTPAGRAKVVPSTVPKLTPENSDPEGLRLPVKLAFVMFKPSKPPPEKTRLVSSDASPEVKPENVGGGGGGGGGSTVPISPSVELVPPVTGWVSVTTGGSVTSGASSVATGSSSISPVTGSTNPPSSMVMLSNSVLPVTSMKRTVGSGSPAAVSKAAASASAAASRNCCVTSLMRSTLPNKSSIWVGARSTRVASLVRPSNTTAWNG